MAREEMKYAIEVRFVSYELHALSYRIFQNPKLL